MIARPETSNSGRSPSGPNRASQAESSASRRVVVAGLAATAASSAGLAAAAPKISPQPRDHAYEVLEVGPGKRFASLTLAGVFMNSEKRWNNGYAGADKISRMGFRVVISPGPPNYYVNDSGSHSRRWKELEGWPPYEGGLRGPVIIEGEPGKPPPVLCTDGHGDGVLYYQTGLFETADCDATFRRLIFRGFRRSDGYGNYAGIRLGDSSFDKPLHNRVVIEDCEFTACDDGIMGGRQGQSIEIRRCYFHDNGNHTGRVHNIYIGDADELLVEDLLSTRCVIGHLLKTRAAKTTVRNSRLIGDGGSESSCLDVPNAGVLELDNVVCQKSPNSDAIWTIHYSGEDQGFHDPSSVTIRNLTLITPETLKNHPSWGHVGGFADQSGSGAGVSGKGSHPVRIDAQDVEVYGLTQKDAGLPCRILRQPPAIDLRSPVLV